MTLRGTRDVPATYLISWLSCTCHWRSWAAIVPWIRSRLATSARVCDTTLFNTAKALDAFLYICPLKKVILDCLSRITLSRRVQAMSFPPYVECVTDSYFPPIGAAARFALPDKPFKSLIARRTVQFGKTGIDPCPAPWGTMIHSRCNH